MRTSELFLPTLKETPAEAEIVSHQLMLRAGLIRRLAAGLYTWLPVGMRVLRRVEGVVREEMNAAGAQELLMPAIQPAELWQESGRWDKYGPELLRLKDRHERDACYAPTHEEVITDLVRREVHSYKQLPLNLYQIQTKFRDEIRPRFGVMRAREFLMKDAYSFHLTEDSLEETYQRMHEAYSRIFRRLGLEFRAVEADTGAIGGSISHEFHVLADSGEDAVASCTRCSYAANVELAESQPPSPAKASPQAPREVPTPGVHTVAEQAAALGLELDQIVKSVVVFADETPAVLFVAGDDELNDVKAARALGAGAVRMAEGAEAERVTGAPLGSIGPKGLPEGLRVLVDYRAARIANFSSGANRPDLHWVNLNWGHDVPLPEEADLRIVREGDDCPHCTGHLTIRRGIEVGHIFKLGTRYSEAMDATVLDEDGTERPLIMGCYGIGVSRVVAAAIEQNHDSQGIAWPQALAPFDVVVIPINAHKSATVREQGEAVTRELEAAGLSVLLEDRPIRPGVMFAEAELVGLPHRLVISERGLETGQVEYRGRRDSENTIMPRDEAVGRIAGLVEEARLGGT